jgi:hypothetical protein
MPQDRDMSKRDARMERIKAAGMSAITEPLSVLATKGLLPTPKSQDAKHALRDRKKSNLGEEMSEWSFQTTGKTSRLNPLFVAEMMGFPTDWTVLPFQNGGTNPSKPSETPLSRR